MSLQIKALWCPPSKTTVKQVRLAFTNCEYEGHYHHKYHAQSKVHFNQDLVSLHFDSLSNLHIYSITNAHA